MRILTLGRPELLKVSEPVDNIDGSLAKQIESMFDVMLEKNGLGLAAAQVNIHKRFFVICLKEPEVRIAFINPEILAVRSKEVSLEEGCLSIPGIYGPVVRPAGVTVKYLDIDGKEHELKAKDLLARVILHEYDHLDGRLFLSRLAPEYLRQLADELDKVRSVKGKK